jgi:tetratricopeptide (TPR) repeat protein
MNVAATSRVRSGLGFASHSLLVLAIAGSALAIGAVHTFTLCIVTVVLAIAFVTAWWDAQSIDVRPAATLLLVVGVCLTTYTVLQCIPIPVRWLAAIAPYNADVWSRSLSPLREAGPAWAPLSLDPSATRVEVLKGVAYLLTFATSLRIARRREGAALLAVAVMTTGVILAAAALLHPAFGAHKLFGLYEPDVSIAERHLAPLLNPNNLAEYLNMSLCLALAIVLSREPAIPRPIASVVVLFLGGTQLWVASRGGVVAMGLGILLVLAFAGLTKAHRHRPAAILSLMAGLGAATGATLIVLAGSDEASSELLVNDVSKLTLFFRMMRMMPAVPVFGCGRGAFESAFPAFRIDAGYVTFAYPENVVAQWLLEWGIPVGAAGLLAVVVALRPSAALARSTAVGGAWAAVIALTVQNLGDLGSEVPGIVVAGVVCAALVVAGTPGRKSRSSIQRWSRAPRFVTASGMTAAVAAVVIAARGIGHELHDDQHTLYEHAVGERLGSSARDAAARTAMLRHPAEPYLPFSVAVQALRDGDESPLPWLEATLERARIYAPAHLLLARTMVSYSRSQALLEYRFAMEQANELDGIVLTEAVRLLTDYRTAIDLVPETPDAILVLQQIAQRISDRLPSTRVRLDAELRRRRPSMPGPALRVAEDAVSDIETDTEASWCADSKRVTCVFDALRKTERAEEIDPEACAPHVLQARARAASGDGVGGLSELESAADSVKDRVECLQQLEALAWRLGDSERVQAALTKVVAAGCTDDNQCARNLTWVAQQEDALGHRSRALIMYKRAYEHLPDDDSLLERVASRAAEAGLHVEAAEDYEKLALKRPSESRWKAAEDSERKAAMKNVSGF